jgi:hypothetical protein
LATQTHRQRSNLFSNKGEGRQAGGVDVERHVGHIPIWQGEGTRSMFDAGAD